MKKIITIFLSIILMTTSLSGCSHTKKPSPENPVTLTLWHVYGSQTTSPLNNIIDEFNKTVGKENGITINIVSVTSSSAIDSALAASANNEPGAVDMPDIFIAYPRVVEIVGRDNLLTWNNYFTDEELSLFNEEFLSEGYFDNELLMLPIAKSSEAFFINQTLFERFSTETGVNIDTLETFNGIFETANIYYDWSGGQNFIQINDYYRV
ncbi:MAG: carbohydrate ABC transporter substrate-binding protein [Lachnospiraceae bacterium]|nr:carbohydrate ABC transporter substrate-binding protein [Lachnospiraceae bacterium]